MPEAIQTGVLAADASEREADLVSTHRGSATHGAHSGSGDVKDKIVGTPKRRISVKTSPWSPSGQNNADVTPAGGARKRARNNASGSPAETGIVQQLSGAAATSPQPLPTSPAAEIPAGSPANPAASAGSTGRAAHSAEPQQAGGDSAAGAASGDHRIVAAVSALAVGAGLAAGTLLPQKRSTADAADRSDRAAGAAEKRRQAERERGLGPDAAAELEQQSRADAYSRPDECAENFGYRSRGKLRRDLDERRRADAEEKRKPSLQICTVYTHVCATDDEHGCGSCSRMCHADCTSVLCKWKPCEFCLSLGEVVAAGSSACSDFQRRNGCHSCRQGGCWNFSPTCPGSCDVSENALGARSTSASSSLGPHGMCSKNSHRCREDRDYGCQACMKTCHSDNTSDLCPYKGRDRGKVWWTPKNADDMLDTQRYIQDLGGRRRHRTQFQWDRVGKDAAGRRVVRIPGEGVHYLGFASGHDCNCFVYSLEQCVQIATDVDAVRISLQVDFPRTCGPGCSPTAAACTNNCMKVYERNYLSTDHWSAVLRSIGQHARGGPQNVDVSQYCLRVIDLAFVNSGVVLGDPAAPRKITVAREGRNHFVPVLPYTDNVEAVQWRPW